MSLSGRIEKSSKCRQKFRKSVESLYTKHDQVVVNKKKRQYQYKVPTLRAVIGDANKENVFFSEEKNAVDLYCNETMEDVFKKPGQGCAIILNEKDEEIARIARELKSLFHSMNQNEEYPCMTQKRIMILQTIMQMYEEFRSNGITQAVVVSSVALMDWIGVHKRDYFCEENHTRIACFCILESMKSNGDDLHLDNIYTASFNLIYGDNTEENMQKFWESSELLESIISIGKYRDCSYMVLMAIYNDYIDEETHRVLTEVFFKKLSCETKYRLTDMYEEFVESVVQNSQNTHLNFEIMHDYITAISR